MAAARAARNASPQAGRMSRLPVRIRSFNPWVSTRSRPRPRPCGPMTGRRALGHLVPRFLPIKVGSAGRPANWRDSGKMAKSTGPRQTSRARPILSDLAFCGKCARYSSCATSRNRPKPVVAIATGLSYRMGTPRVATWERPPPGTASPTSRRHTPCRSTFDLSPKGPHRLGRPIGLSVGTSPGSTSRNFPMRVLLWLLLAINGGADRRQGADRPARPARLAGQPLGAGRHGRQEVGRAAADPRDPPDEAVGRVGPQGPQARRHPLPPGRRPDPRRLVPLQPVHRQHQRQPVFARRHPRHRGRRAGRLRHHQGRRPPPALQGLGPRQRRRVRRQAAQARLSQPHPQGGRVPCTRSTRSRCRSTTSCRSTTASSTASRWPRRRSATPAWCSPSRSCWPTWRISTSSRSACSGSPT